MAAGFKSSFGTLLVSRCSAGRSFDLAVHHNLIEKRSGRSWSDDGSVGIRQAQKNVAPKSKEFCFPNHLFRHDAGPSTI